MIRVAVLALALLVATLCPALASPSVVQSKCTVSSSTLSMNSTPTNGNVMAAGQTNSSTLASATLKDSNSVALTLDLNEGASTAWGAVWHYLIAGSPTSTYTSSTTPVAWCQWEISGASSSVTTCGNNTSSATGSTLTCTIAGVQSGDILTLAARDSNGFTAVPTSTNGSYTNSNSCSGGSANCVGYFTATSTASTTFTVNVTVGDPVGMAVEDITSPPSGAPLAVQVIGSR